MLAAKAHNTAQMAMEGGRNCCEAVLLAADAVYDIGLDDDYLAAASLFQEGIYSGCTCGALVGLIMAAGVLNRRDGLHRDKRLAKRLHDRFQQEFGSTCCRTIIKKRPLWQRINHKKECFRLAARAAAILVEEWADEINGPAGHLDNSSHL